MKRIKNCQAEGYVDVVVTVLIVCFLLALMIGVFGAISQKQDLKYMCSELVEVATTTGQVGDAVQQRYEMLCAETGLTPTVSFQTVYFDDVSKKVQFGEIISCTLTMDSGLAGLGNEIFTFSMTATESGLSQIYWK